MKNFDKFINTLDRLASFFPDRNIVIQVDANDFYDIDSEIKKKSMFSEPCDIRQLQEVIYRNQYNKITFQRNLL